jgi:hypothetical protein
MALKYFHKYKASSPNKCPREIYLGLLILLALGFGLGLLKAIEKFKNVIRILMGFNTTFITNILKKDNPSSSYKFRPILLQNSIYKTITQCLNLFY